MINLREFFGLSYYTSTLDKFLGKFRKSQQKISASQQREINKYARIHALRDQAPASSAHPSTKLWDQF